MVTFNFSSLSTDENEEDKHKLIQLYKIKSITKIKAYVIITNNNYVATTILNLIHFKTFLILPYFVNAKNKSQSTSEVICVVTLSLGPSSTL
jgi:hypothetical protein